MTGRVAGLVRACVGDAPGVRFVEEAGGVSVRRVDGGIMHLDEVRPGLLQWAMPPDPAVVHVFDTTQDPGLVEAFCLSFVSNAIELGDGRAILGRPVRRVVQLSGNADAGRRLRRGT